jgi:hypothetical protein
MVVQGLPLRHMGIILEMYSVCILLMGSVLTLNNKFSLKTTEGISIFIQLSGLLLCLGVNQLKGDSRLLRPRLRECNK